MTSPAPTSARDDVAGARAGLGERLARGAVAVVVAAFAGSMMTTHPVVGVGAGVLALAIAAMAVTGRCLGTSCAPASAPSPPPPQNTLGYPEAHQRLDVR
ncbi:hypothetical protein [Georgenia faecalis]|uniref:hypothetical protein n=1 Tax=Georgenia faecalis TaxID=2483799 RepID=UPI000FDC0D2E|nr:hypothetical protein [Georgenia faecalis]